jgi:hypothetical protein
MTRTRGWWLGVALVAGGLAGGRRALESCNAMISGSDGVITLNARQVSGTVLWGAAAGAETRPFSHTTPGGGGTYDAVAACTSLGYSEVDAWGGTGNQQCGFVSPGLERYSQNGGTDPSDLSRYVRWRCIGARPTP